MKAYLVLLTWFYSDVILDFFVGVIIFFCFVVSHTYNLFKTSHGN